MKTAFEVLVFKKMISPLLLQILFWGAIGGTFYGTFVLIILDQWAWPLALVFGTLTVRVLFEGFILAFRSYERMGEVRDAVLQLGQENA